MKPILILLFLTCLLLPLGCKPDDGNVSLSKTELLAGTLAKTWAITAERYNGKDAFSSEPACYKDDNYIFRANSQYEINEGATKCTASDPQIIDNGTWSLKTNDTELTVGDETYKLVELTAQTLRVSLTDGPDSYEFTFTAR